MKKLAFALIVLSVTSMSAYAHPGRTASDGCHYCRTNCAYWGVPLDQRHCHGNNNNEQGQTLIKTASHKSSLLDSSAIKTSHDHESFHTHKEN